jgi:hypothetical protein
MLFADNQGIYFNIEVSSRCFGFEKDGNTHHPEWEGSACAYFHTIILNRHQVFTCITDEHRLAIPEPSLWENTSNHDSCWTSGMDKLVHLRFAVYDLAWENQPKELHPQSKDSVIDMDFSRWGPMFKLVETEKEAIDPHHSYHKRLTKIKEIEMDNVKL